MADLLDPICSSESSSIPQDLTKLCNLAPRLPSHPVNPQSSPSAFLQHQQSAREELQQHGLWSWVCEMNSYFTLTGIDSASNIIPDLKKGKGRGKTARQVVDHQQSGPLIGPL